MSIFKKLTEKPGELLEINRLNKQINAEEEKVQEAFLTMGKSVFESQGKGEPIPPESIVGSPADFAARLVRAMSGPPRVPSRLMLV